MHSNGCIDRCNILRLHSSHTIFLVMLSLPGKWQIIFHLFSTILSPGGSGYFMKIKLYCLFGSLYCLFEIANTNQSMIILFSIIRLLLFINYEADRYCLVGVSSLVVLVLLFPHKLCCPCKSENNIKIDWKAEKTQSCSGEHLPTLVSFSRSKFSNLTLLK